MLSRCKRGLRDDQEYFRTFRFISDDNSPDEQEQTVRCIIHLNPFNDTDDESQASDCNCYTQEECENPPAPVSNNYRFDPNYDTVLVLGQTSGNPLTHGHHRAVLLTPENGEWKRNFETSYT